MELNKNRDLISKRHSCSFIAPNSTTQKGTNYPLFLNSILY